MIYCDRIVIILTRTGERDDFYSSRRYKRDVQKKQKPPRTDTNNNLFNEKRIHIKTPFRRR